MSSTKSRQNLRHRRRAYINADKKRVGKCFYCGFKKCYEILEYHHTQNNKLFNVGGKLGSTSIRSIQKEMDKCILVCKNCHSLIHRGFKLKKCQEKCQKNCQIKCIKIVKEKVRGLFEYVKSSIKK